MYLIDFIWYLSDVLVVLYNQIRENVLTIIFNESNCPTLTF